MMNPRAHLAEAVVGLDLGATRIKVGLVGEAGHCEPLDGCPTEAAVGGDRVYANLERMLDAALAHAKAIGCHVRGVGVGTPGGVRQPEGTVLAAGENIRDWEGRLLGTPLSEHAGGLPTVVDNDANAATLAEWTFGQAFGDARIAVGLTLGTGVGGGILIDGRLLRGWDGMAGELGHVGMDMAGPECACGMRGCLEVFATIRSVEMLAAQARVAGCDSEWTAVRGGDVVPAAIEAARAGDAAAVALWEEYGQRLGYGISGIVAVLRPDVIVLFGGLTHAAEFFLPAAERMAHTRPRPGPRFPIRLTTLGYHAGVQGAAALVWAALRGEQV